jgi:hypothetical protein
MKIDELKNKVVDKISDYIEFDVNMIFDVGEYIAIYGGAVRDSLAEMPINDIDILCLSKSAFKIKELIISLGYKELDLYDKDAIAMYNDIHIINEPWTFMNNNFKTIQIIRPAFGTPEHFYKILKNVDISCCGVFLDKMRNNISLKESCQNSIYQCLSKTFIINSWAELYASNRTLYREEKLKCRGWSIENEDTDTQKNRFYKLINLESEANYDYKIWTEFEYRGRKKQKYYITIQ